MQNSQLFNKLNQMKSTKTFILCYFKHKIKSRCYMKDQTKACYPPVMEASKEMANFKKKKQHTHFLYTVSKICMSVYLSQNLFFFPLPCTILRAIVFMMGPQEAPRAPFTDQMLQGPRSSCSYFTQKYSRALKQINILY